MQETPSAKGGRPPTLCSLDMIISAGYRVKSPRGVEFRQWATRILKERLVADYKKRAKAAEQHLAAFRNVELLANQSDADAHVVLDLIGRYARSWRLLLQYDENKLPPPPTQPSKGMGAADAQTGERDHRPVQEGADGGGSSRGLFGRVREDGVASVLRNIEQTWGGAPLYPNVETRAANLRYFDP